MPPKAAPLFDITILLVDGSKVEYESPFIPFLSPTMPLTVPDAASKGGSLIIPPTAIVWIDYRPKAGAKPASRA